MPTQPLRFAEHTYRGYCGNCGYQGRGFHYTPGTQPFPAWWAAAARVLFGWPLAILMGLNYMNESTAARLTCPNCDYSFPFDDTRRVLRKWQDD